MDLLVGGAILYSSATLAWGAKVDAAAVLGRMATTAVPPLSCLAYKDCRGFVRVARGAASTPFPEESVMPLQARRRSTPAKPQFFVDVITCRNAGTC